MRITFSRFFLIVFAALMMFGCGSGSAVSLPQTNTAEVTFSAANATPGTPVSSMIMKFRLPDGVTVALQPRTPADTGPEETIVAGALKTLTINSTVTGTYLTATREITLTVTVNPPTDFGANVANFAQVSVSCAAGITKADFVNSNPNLAANLVVNGFENGTTKPNLTGFTPSMDVTF
jgi:hypothetical protein